MEFSDGIMGEFRGHADVESLTLLSRSIILKVIFHFGVGKSTDDKASCWAAGTDRFIREVGAWF